MIHSFKVHLIFFIVFMKFSSHTTYKNCHTLCKLYWILFKLQGYKEHKLWYCTDQFVNRLVHVKVAMSDFKNYKCDLLSRLQIYKLRLGRQIHTIRLTNIMQTFSDLKALRVITIRGYKAKTEHVKQENYFRCR